MSERTPRQQPGRGPNDAGPKPPSAFDVVKELNAQAARLATLYGLLLTAVSFSLGAGPIKDGLTAFSSAMELRLGFRDVVAIVVPFVMLCALIVAGVTLINGIIEVLHAMEPSVPRESTVSEEAWKPLLRVKRVRCEKAGWLLRRAVSAILIAWALANTVEVLAMQGGTVTDIRPPLLSMAVVFGLFTMARNVRGMPFFPWGSAPGEP